MLFKKFSIMWKTGFSQETCFKCLLFWKWGIYVCKVLPFLFIHPFNCLNNWYNCLFHQGDPEWHTKIKTQNHFINRKINIQFSFQIRSFISQKFPMVQVGWRIYLEINFWKHLKRKMKQFGRKSKGTTAFILLIYVVKNPIVSKYSWAVQNIRWNKMTVIVIKKRTPS